MFQRPSSITFMAILGCVLGALGLVCAPLNALGFLVSDPQEMAEIYSRFNIPVPEISQTARVLIIISSLLGTFISLIQVVGAGGSLAMKPWARTCINCYAVLQIINSVFYAVVNQLYLAPATMASMSGSALSGSPTAMAVGSLFGNLVSLVFSCSFATAFLFVYNTRANREAFANGGMIAGQPYYAPAPPPGYGYPGGYYVPGQQPPAGAPGYQQPPVPQYPQAPPPQYPQAPPGYQQVPPGYQPVPQGPPRDPGPLPPPPQQPPQYPPQA